MPDPVVAISAGPGVHAYGAAGELLNRLRDHEPAAHRIVVLDADRDPDARPWPDGLDVLTEPGASPAAGLVTALAHASACAPGAALVWLDPHVDLTGPLLDHIGPPGPQDGLLRVTGPAWRFAPEPPRVPRIATRPALWRELRGLRAEARTHGWVPAADAPGPGHHHAGHGHDHDHAARTGHDHVHADDHAAHGHGHDHAARTGHDHVHADDHAAHGHEHDHLTPPAPADAPPAALVLEPALIAALDARRLLRDPARWRHAPLGPRSLAALLTAATGLRTRDVTLPTPVPA